MHFNTTLIASLAAILLLAGCTIVPGSDLPYDSAQQGHWFTGENDQQAPPSLPDLVHIYPIDAGILANQPVAQESGTRLPSVADADASAKSYRYKVGVGDILQITVWDHPELTIPAGSKRSPAEAGIWVHSDGSIFYPYVGRIEVAGLTVVQIRKLITKRISQYIENPQVGVTVAAFKSEHVYVTGAVQQPGVIPITNVPLHLVDAINAAGGLNQRANWRDVTLVRNHHEYDLSLKAIYQNGKLKQNLLLEGGDVINVGRVDDSKIFVLGEVTKPQALAMGRNGMNLAEALASVGGIDQMQADASGIFVLRKGTKDGKPSIDVYQLNAKNAVALVLASEFHLQPKDIVYVTAAPVSLWNRVLSQLMPTVQAIYYSSLAADRVRSLDE